MTFGTWLHTKVNGKHVGEDMFGNRYYIERNTPKGRRQKRWVVYKGIAEPSKVPPLWHAWLHYMFDDLPQDLDIATHEWQKDHLPNLTGTKNAYKPSGHLLSSTSRDASVSDYESWTPGS